MAGESAGDAGTAPGGAGGRGGAPIGGRGGRGGGGFSGVSGSSGVAGGGRGGFAGAAGIAGGGFGGSGGSAGGPLVPCGFYDCARLPHVRPDAENVECQNGVCIIPQDACEENYTHCTTNFNVGCETYLGSINDCGVCGRRCIGGTPVCADDGSGFQCGTGCSEPRPDRCGFGCTDLDTDEQNCGACFVQCSNSRVVAECQNRVCVATGACEAPWGDCDGMFGCETELLTPENCGACGRNNCGATNASPECSSLTGCVKPTCNPGYGNCDITSLDCEATYGASCFPIYAGTRRIALIPNAAAVAPGGSFALGGMWAGELDFDASLAVDRLTSDYSGDGYVTRYDANGAYSWTRAVVTGNGYELVNAVAMAADGSVVAVGAFNQPVDLDPGSGVLEHDPNYQSAMFVSKLSTAGTLTWARVIIGVELPGQVATDASGAVYFAGAFSGEIDLDPGTGEDLHEDFTGGGFLVKLDASGSFVWSRLVEGASNEAFFGVSAAPDGSVWTIGRHNGSASVAGTTLSSSAGAVLAGFEAAGGVRRVANFDYLYNAYFPNYKVSAGTNAVHVSGAPYQGSDLDPGTGVVNRYSLEQSAFVVHLDGTGAYREAHVFPAYDFPELAGTPTGVLFGQRSTSELRAYTHDGVSSWTMQIGNTFGMYHVASSTTHFIVIGGEYGAADYDPGPGTDVIYGSTQLVTRYAF
jgi:hypothetical protein